MGIFSSKDKNIDIYIQVNKPIYITGQFVEGNIYINCKENSDYLSLSLELKGQERCQWSQGSGKNRTYYSNHKVTYQSESKVYDFMERKVFKGHYAFPFRILLPESLNGTFYESSRRFLRMTLSAMLSPSNSQNKRQEFGVNLNIIEPLRNQFGPISQERSLNPKCCGCCINYGNVTVGISTDKNYVKSGDMVQVNGIIDNSKGNKEITSGHVAFVQNRAMISSGGRVNLTQVNKFTLFNIEKSIPKGAQQSVNVTVTIPSSQKLIYSTAIGSCIARYFTMQLDSSIGCCAMATKSSVHLIFHSNSPKKQKLQEVSAPVDWNPHFYPQVQLTDLKPYVYSPLAKIPMHNRQNDQNVNFQGGYNANGYQGGNNLDKMNDGYFNSDKSINSKHYQ